MTIPDYQTLMLPVLRSFRSGEAKMSDVIASLADECPLTEAERVQLLPSGRTTLFSNRVHWAKTYLKQAGLITPTRRAYFRLTERGEKALASGLTRIGNRYLAQFPEFQDFKARSSKDEGEAGVAPVVKIHGPVDTDTPDEVMRAAHQQVMQQLRTDLLERVLEASPEFFERLIVELLVSMGFGGSAELAGRVCVLQAAGRSG